MTAGTFKTGAIGDKRKLLKFFAIKEHHNLVLRVVDVLELRNDQQDWLIERAAEISARSTLYSPAVRADGWRKRWLLNEYPNGHIVLPFTKLLAPLDMEQVMVLQEICMAYYGVRLNKGEPSRVEACDACKGTGRRAAQKCDQCDGGGSIIIFLEMSDEERQLATAVA